MHYQFNVYLLDGEHINVLKKKKTIFLIPKLQKAKRLMQIFLKKVAVNSHLQLNDPAPKHFLCLFVYAVLPVELTLI